MTSSPPPPALLDDRFTLPIDRPFTVAQALDAGLTYHRIRVLDSSGLIRRVLKSVYVAAQAPDGILLRAQALSLVVPPAAVVTDWTALWFWTGMLPPNGHLEMPPLSFFHRNPHARLRNQLCASGARSLLPSDVTRCYGLKLTTPIRTAWDLGRLAHRDSALGAIDSLLRHGGFSRGDLVDGVGRFKGMRGVVQLRSLAPLGDARAESLAESTLRLRWLDLSSLPAPTPQVPVMVGGVEIYRIDLAVPELRYGCEYDGEDHHSSALDRDHDRARRLDLERRFGWDVDAVRRQNVYGATRDIEGILHAGIQRARQSLAARSAYAG